MKYKDIVEMRPGKDLDVLVYESVYKGECAHILNMYEEDNDNPWYENTVYRCKKCGATFEGDGFEQDMIVCPDYSTKVGYAIALVYNFDSFKIEKKNNKSFICEVSDSFSTKKYEADNIAEAITKAILLLTYEIDE